MNYTTLPQAELDRISALFKIMGHPRRLQLLHLLMQNRMTVSEICSALKWEQSAVSHQLQMLKKAGVVTSLRQGKNVIYQLTDPRIMTLIMDAL